jgi:hypothetical protein
MSPEDLVYRFPFLYHVAADGSWPSIARHGLMSTAALLDVWACDAEVREEVETRRRSKSVSLRHHVYGTAVVRDQQPLSDLALTKCLVGMSLRDWYRLLNGQVFFWVKPEKMRAMVNAYPETYHSVLTVDTKQLLARHFAKVRLSAINSGSTRRRPALRGRATFRPISGYDPSGPVQELTVAYSVPDIKELVVKIDRLSSSELASSFRGEHES